MLTLELSDPQSSVQLREIALKIRASKKTVVVAGAGISSNAGIPDFRSRDGLYSLVKQQYKDTFVKGKDLFDVILFRDEKSTGIFYSFMAGLRNATLDAQPTHTHQLLKLLKDKKKLLRCYTQNIDGLEYRAGLGFNDTVQLHGDLHKLKCMNCSQTYQWSPAYAEEMKGGDAPDCENCINTSLARFLSGKRSTSVGRLRPDIVLYGEDHPSGDAISLKLAKDCSRSPQLLIVMGTSLKVVGIKRLVRSLAQATHAVGGMVIIVNKTSVSRSEWQNIFDYHVLADSDAWVANVRSYIPSFFEVQTKLNVERKRKGSAQPEGNKADPKLADSIPHDQPPDILKVNLAKRTKSDPYTDNIRQNQLLNSPQKEHNNFDPSALWLEPPSSPSTEILDLPDEIAPLKLEQAM